MIKTKSHKLIISLLVVSIVTLLLLQAYWIKNFYVQKQEAFSANVFSSLEKIRLKLNERENNNIGKKNINSSNDFKLESPSFSIQKSNSVQTINHSIISSKDELKNVFEIKKENQKYPIGDSILEVIRMPKEINLNSKNKKSINFTIRIVDSDETNIDTLNKIIKNVFTDRELLLPFEFSVKKILNNSSKTITQTKHFDDKDKSYTLDLSTNKPFTTNNYLFIQFPNKNAFVTNLIKPVLVLSIVFSLIMICIFYYTIHLMLKQKKINDIKNDFINNMTHELKTPIATISLATDAITNFQIKNNEEKFNHYIYILKEENQKLNTHVERVLEMALLDKKALVFNKKICNLIEIIETALKVHKLQIESKNAVVFFHKNENIELELDDNHILAVFNNLIDNALKYSKENCEINIAVTNNKDFVLVNIKDNGIGIDQNLKDKIFEKFYRVQNGNVHDIKGFGLGLAYVQSILCAHNATIVVESKKNLGSEFIIKFKKHV